MAPPARVEERAHSATANPRRFLSTFAGVLGGLILATCAFSTLVDPLGVFGTGLVPPVVGRDRDEKADEFLHSSPSPQVLVLGSSRVQRLPPECITELTGLPAFNFGTSSARAEDQLAAFRFAASTPGVHLRQLIVGVDPETFHDTERPDVRLRASRALARFADLDPPTLEERGTWLLGANALQAGFRSLRHAIFPPGDVPVPVNTLADTATTIELSKALGTAVGLRRGPYANFRHLSPRRLDEFRTLAAEAHARGVRVDVYINPFHPLVVREIGPVLGERLADVDVFLRSLEAQGLVRYHPTMALASFGGSETAYVDGVHMTRANSTRLLLAIEGRSSGCGVP